MDTLQSHDTARIKDCLEQGVDDVVVVLAGSRTRNFAAAAGYASVEDLGAAFPDREDVGVASDPLPTHPVEPAGRSFTQISPDSVFTDCVRCVKLQQ
jgi:hypothetical protein